VNRGDPTKQKAFLDTGNLPPHPVVIVDVVIIVLIKGVEEEAKVKEKVVIIDIYCLLE